MSVDGTGGDLLQSAGTRTDVVRDRWARMPQGRRRLSILAAGLAVAIVGGSIGLTRLHAYLHERSLRDQVSLSATVEVAASSTTLAGGRVDYYLAVQNRGPRQVLVSSLQLRDARLHIVSRNFTGLLVGPGTTVDVPVSVRLDCVRLGAGGAGPLHGTVSATPQSGRERGVAAALSQTNLVTDVAQTLCSVRPDLRGRELSGVVS